MKKSAVKVLVAETIGRRVDELWERHRPPGASGAVHAAFDLGAWTMIHSITAEEIAAAARTVHGVTDEDAVRVGRAVILALKAGV